MAEASKQNENQIAKCNDKPVLIKRTTFGTWNLVQLFRVFTLMMSNIHLADEGLDKLKKNRNPRLAKLECLLFFRTTLATYGVISDAAVYEGGTSAFDLQTGHIMLAEVDGETLITLFGKYINSIGEDYLNELENRIYLTEILTALRMIVETTEDILAGRYKPDPRFQYTWSRFIHETLRIQDLEKKADREKLLLHIQPSLDVIQRGLLTIASHLCELETEVAAKLGNRPDDKPEEPNRSSLKRLVRIAVRLEKDGPLAQEVRARENILPDDRYNAIIPALAIWYHMPPSITHFTAVCRYLEQYAILAANEDLDCDLSLRPYFSDSIGSLSKHPKRTKNSTTLAELTFTAEERKAMTAAFDSMSRAFLRYRKAIKHKFGDDCSDPDNYDSFVAAIHDTLLDDMDDVEKLLFEKGCAKNNDDYNSCIFTLLSGALTRLSWSVNDHDDKLLKDAKTINPILVKVYKSGSKEQIGQTLDKLHEKYFKHLPRLISKTKEMESASDDTQGRLTDALNEISGGPREWEAWASDVANGKILIKGRFKFADDGLTISDTRQKVTWEKNISGRAYEFIVKLIRAYSEKQGNSLPSTYDCPSRQKGKGRWVNDFHQGSPAQTFWDMEIGTKERACFIKPDQKVSKIKGRMRRCVKDGTNTTLK